MSVKLQLFIVWLLAGMWIFQIWRPRPSIHYKEIMESREYRQFCRKVGIPSHELRGGAVTASKWLGAKVHAGVTTPENVHSLIPPEYLQRKWSSPSCQGPVTEEYGLQLPDHTYQPIIQITYHKNSRGKWVVFTIWDDYLSPGLDEAMVQSFTAFFVFCLALLATFVIAVVFTIREGRSAFD